MEATRTRALFRFGPMGRILFVTGTGTDVGKTGLSLAILLWARDRGLDAAYLKPVQCGTYPFGEPPVEGGDADWIRTLSGGRPAYVTCALRMPASPHLAAEREGIAIDPASLRRDAEAKAAGRDILVLEGAGGAAVPLDRGGSTLAGLARDLNAPALIACAPGLGTLHHTLASAAWLKQAGVAIAGFAICRRLPGDDPLEEDNRRTLKELLGFPCFGAVPFAPALGHGRALGPAEAAALWAPLAPALETWFASKQPERP
jgi:dethiobiotin synthetase